MNLRSCISASVVFLLLSGCAAEKQGLVGSAPPEELVQHRSNTTNIKLGEQPKKDKKVYPEPRFVAEGWPYQEDNVSFRLTWDAEKTKLPLLDAPTFNGNIIGEGTWKRGAELAWTNSSVGVYEPTEYRAKHEVSIDGQIYSNDYRTGNDGFSADLRKGERIELYHYASGGMCFLRVREVMIESLCPREEDFGGPFSGADLAQIYQPQRRQWWVHVNAAGGGAGWMPLDDRVIVDILR